MSGTAVAVLRSGRSLAFTRAGQLIQLVGSKEYTGSNPAIASIYKPYRVSIMVMLAITFITVVFGMLVPVDSAAVAQAHVAVLGNRKTVQHLEGGIVRKLLVKEGDVVSEGQPLLELSDVLPKANRSILQNQLYGEQITQARLAALRDGKETMTISPKIQTAAKNDADLARMIAEQNGLFKNQRQAYLDKHKTLSLKIDQTNEEISGLEAQVKSASGQLTFISDEIETVGKLVKKGLAVKPRLLALLREKEKLTGDRGQYTASISKAKQSINEIEVQLLNLKNEFNTQVSDELKDNHTKLADAEEKLQAASDIVDRTIVAAPTEGIVTGLKYHTEGGVIAPGAPIMDIIPQDEELVLEARINPIDIDVVTTDMEARVVFSAYRTRTLPELKGKVMMVSADSFSDPQNAQASAYYMARVMVDREQMQELAPQIKLYPGMPAEVYIKTGSRSFLGYLFAPITDSFRKAFKES